MIGAVFHIFHALKRRLRHYVALARTSLARINPQIEIGTGSTLSLGVRVQFESYRGGELLQVGHDSKLKGRINLFTRRGTIRLGDHVSINDGAYFMAYGGIEIGDYVRIAKNCTIVAFNHNFDDSETPIALQGNTAKGIRVGNNVWIGANVTILDDVRISDGVVIAAGSVVTKSVPENCIVAGVPARIIRSRV